MRCGRWIGGISTEGQEKKKKRKEKENSVALSWFDKLCFTHRLVGIWKFDLAVNAARTQQGRIQNIHAIRAH
jgi:hypothetical protein